MPQIKSSFILNSSQPNFERDRYANLSEMKNVDSSSIDNGHIVYCEETKKHYIFRDDYDMDGKTGRFRELLLQDVQVVDNKSDLSGNNQYLLNQLPVGKLVYCKEDTQIYYKYEENGRKGFKLLIDLQSSNYISTSSPEWSLIEQSVTELQNAGMLVFETVWDMKNITNVDIYKPGQLAYCKENNQHYYLPDDLQYEEFFGYFRTVCDESDRYPKIVQPYSYISIEKQNYDNGWRWIERDDEVILLINEDKANDAKQNFNKYIKVDINRGTIDYTDYPYWDDNNRRYAYIGTDELIETLIPDVSFNLGDNSRQLSSKPSGFIPIIKDIDGIEIEEISWGSKDLISNSVTINVTRPWKATTESGTPSDQPLIPWEDIMNGEAILIPTCQGSQKIVIPEGREARNAKIYINILGEWYDETHEWSRSGQTFTYKTNEYGQRGNVKIKVIF